MRARWSNQRERFDELCRLAEAEATPDQLAAIAAHLNNLEHRLAEILLPVIRTAEQTIAKRLPASAAAAQKSFYKLSEDAADIAATWLELHQNTQIRLHLLRSEKMKAQGEPPSPVFSSANEAIRYLKGRKGER